MFGFGVLFSWSVLAEQLIYEKGIVTKASNDWSM